LVGAIWIKFDSNGITAQVKKYFLLFLDSPYTAHCTVILHYYTVITKSYCAISTIFNWRVRKMSTMAKVIQCMLVSQKKALLSLPSNPGTGMPLTSFGGDRLFPRPTHEAVMA
jgi:hypothetical protein